MTISRLLKPLIILLVLGGGGYAAYRYLPRSAGGSTPMMLGEVERRDLTLKVTVAGGIIPKRMALITPPYNGYIKKLYVAVGDAIKAGAPVVSIAQTIGTVDEETFPLRAPLTGRVVQVLKAEGEFVSSQTSGPDGAIVRIDDLTQLFVDASVPEIEIAKLKIGQPVVIRAVALPEKTFKGEILEISRASRTQDRWQSSKVEFPIRVAIHDPGSELLSGMSAVLDVIVQEAKGVLAVRHEYIQKDGAQYFVTLGDGSRRDIEVGLRNDEAFEVKSGLSETDKLRQVDFLQAAGGAPAGRLPSKKR